MKKTRKIHTLDQALIKRGIQANSKRGAEQFPKDKKSTNLSGIDAAQFFNYF